VNENLVFLGEWCIPYEKSKKLKSKNFRIVPFHWDDRDKLLRDYEYLQKLHSQLLTHLTEYLNEYHGTVYSLRFWQTILDPWLLTYLSTAFDRWENLSSLFKENDKIYNKIVWEASDDCKKAPFDYNDFLNSTLSDEWNEFFCNKILSYKYKDRIKFINIASERIQNCGLTESGTNNKPRRFSVTEIQYSIIRFFCPSTDVMIVDTTLGGGIWSKLKLQWTLGKIIFFYVRELANFNLEELKRKYISTDNKKRTRLILNSLVQNTEFESFIKINILTDLPVSALEAFFDLKNYASQIPINPKVIITAGAHWSNTLAKFWFAVKQEFGVKVIISEHGGSFPALKELFDFEEDISDIKSTWFLPMHPKQIQLPPLKLVGSYNKWQQGKNEICAILGNECPRYVFRIHFYPLSYQFLYSFSDTKQLYKHLDPLIRKKVFIRPYSNFGWNTSQMFSDYVELKENVSRDGSLKDLMLKSKIVVCTYPETTFSEAMAIGVPTILLFNEKYNERNFVAKAAIDVLKSAKIIFNDPQDAAEHINHIWDNTGAWWNSSEVYNARQLFLEHAAYSGRNWDVKWVNLFKKITKKSSINTILL
jgi:putative transferase (TIGR04331 family)